MVRTYIDLLRTVPEMVLIFWIYFCLPPLLNWTLSGFASGVTALALVASAYLAEIFRAGIESLPPGQVEAARALGLPVWDAPASPCLASRIRYGLEVTPERLRQVEVAEEGGVPAAGLVLEQRAVAGVRHGDTARFEVFAISAAYAVGDGFIQLCAELAANVIGFEAGKVHLFRKYLRRSVAMVIVVNSEREARLPT